MYVNEVKRLRQLEEENRRLKQLVAEKELDIGLSQPRCSMLLFTHAMLGRQDAGKWATPCAT